MKNPFEVRGVLVFLKFHVKSKKLGGLTPQKVKFEQAISMLKHEKLPSTNSTKSGAHQNFATFQQNEQFCNEKYILSAKFNLSKNVSGTTYP